MTTQTQRRDRRGHFVPICKHLTGCDTRAGWYIAGYGAWGLMGTTGRAIFCKRHARQHLAKLLRFHGRDPMTCTYRMERADER